MILVCYRGSRLDGLAPNSTFNYYLIVLSFALVASCSEGLRKEHLTQRTQGRVGASGRMFVTFLLDIPSAKTGCARDGE